MDNCTVSAEQAVMTAAAFGRSRDSTLLRTGPTLEAHIFAAVSAFNVVVPFRIAHRQLQSSDAARVGGLSDLPGSVGRHEQRVPQRPRSRCG
jgi:hypothetical protein